MTRRSTLDETAVPVRHPRVAARVVQGVALVVVLDRHEVHRLDSVGSRIWELCDGRSVGQICDQLVQEFEVSRDTAAHDLGSFLQQLEGLGALTFEGANP